MKIRPIDDDDDREWFEERAAILEFCGGFSRQDAEREAWRELRLRQMRQKYGTTPADAKRSGAR